jgi:AAA domain
MTIAAFTADQVEAIAPEFIWPIQKPGQQGGTLPGRIIKGVQHFIAGKPDKGKGLSAVRIGADLAIAGVNVLHSAIEDQPAGLFTKPRYVAAGCRGDALKRVHLKSFRFPLQRREFEEYVIAHDIKFVVLDPVASHLSGGVNRFTDSIRQVTDPMSAFCAEHGVSVVWIEHVNKNTKGDDPLSAIGGSGSGLVASCRAGYFLGIDPDSEGDRILAHVKGNMMEKPAAMRFELDVTAVPVTKIDPESGEAYQDEEDFPALLFTEECVFDAMRLVKIEKGEGEKHLGRPNDKRQAAAEWLTNHLFNAYTKGLPATADFQAVVQGQGVPAGRVFEDAKLVGITEKTLRRAKTEMGVVVLPVGGGRNAKWNLPDELISVLTGGDTQPQTPQEPAGADASPAVDPATQPAELVATAADLATLDPADANFDAELAKLLGDQPAQ